MYMPLSEERPLLLVVDDDEVFRNRLCRAFEQRNWEAGAVPNGEDAVKFACDRSPDLVLVDLRMPGMGGLEVVQELRAVDSSMTIIVLTGFGDEARRRSLPEQAGGCGPDSGGLRKSPAGPE
jgi:two-component system response regulator RegA